MKKLLKIVAIVVAIAVLLVAGIAALGSMLADRKSQRVIEVPLKGVAFVSDDAAVQRGKYLFESRGCGECHGADGAGHEVINDPGGMYVKSPNISSGPGSVVKGFSEADWDRAIRHGVSSKGHPLLIMPSGDYNRLTDVDLAALVAYACSIAPVPGEAAVIRLPLLVKVLYAFGVIPDAAEQIDHTRLAPAPLPVAVTVEHGGYVAAMCTGCHGAGFSGGKIPGGPPDWPPAANLTPGSDSAMKRYDNTDKFKAMLRTGKRPDGSAVSTVMPFASLGKIDDVDLDALHMYLLTLPPRAAGEH